MEQDPGYRKKIKTGVYVRRLFSIPAERNMGHWIVFGCMSVCVSVIHNAKNACSLPGVHPGVPYTWYPPF